MFELKINNSFLLFCFSLLISLNTVVTKADFKENSKIAKQKTVKLSKEVGSHISDASLTAAVKTNIMTNEDIADFRRINVDTKQRIVYLKGEVPNEKAMIYANKKAKEVKGVRGVINMLKIRALL
ncbi:MAG: BON domain-containing protein [Candidatus Melainabacteria bacterium]|jgi:osmotically-inducible protein OsmY